MIGEPTHADAILDRLVHNAYRIELKGESCEESSPREGKNPKPSHNVNTASLRSDGWPPPTGIRGNFALEQPAALSGTGWLHGLEYAI